ncbi:TetR/AcrR family transcriptional regulator [Bradyrhizobium septentrionale]|uniref:TetR/AcrR family transcriptional regulator n=1 Tax=Bradyrhizobium septentrionale TaxID=1404411 RepID=A0A973VU40_9BRAD|nr:TetR/AcrR family transcriptional regulator [Bradyrhizobium septentrionale]UGY19195.1 TetR/AcrR family transcriptional regulator [Bradyrhizobium septentrionale]UGY27928.1 TetR/AcrR family transcriptional regulator [Bradyrhizobium septentrionale]
MASSSRKARLYGGMDAEERRAERRLRLIDAAIEVYGEVGYRVATVKAICEAAELTERYFYESFANSEALLIAAYNHVVGHLHEEMIAAAAAAGDDPEARLRAALTLYFTRLKQHPKPARVFLLEISGISPAVDAVKLDALRVFSDILVPPASDPKRGDKAAMATLLSNGMVGAVISIALRWVSKQYPQAVEDVVAIAASFCRVALTETNSHTIST